MKKKISVERVDDLMKSVFCGQSLLRNKLYSRIDKLSFVSTLPERSEKEMLWERLFQLSENGRYQITKHKADKGECSGLYRKVIYIRLKNKAKNHPLLMTIHYRPTSKILRRLKNDGMVCHERGAARYEFSPQNYNAHEITDFFVWLGEDEQLGELSYLVLKNAWITRIDYALDIIGMRLCDYYLSLSEVSAGEVYDPDNGMEGLRIGNARLIASCYEKVDVRKLSSRELKQASLLELETSDYRDFLRIELRLAPKKGELCLGDLGTMENLPKRLAFYNRALRKDKKLDPALASLLDEGMSIPQARSMYNSSTVVNGKAVSTNKKQAVKRLERLLLKYREELFDVEKLWSKLPELIDKLGIIGKPQYWNSKLRNKWLDQK